MTPLKFTHSSSMLGAPTRETQSPESGKTTVVIADRHLLFAHGLARLLSRDFEVIAALDNSSQLLAIAAERRPALALIDVGMGDLSGMEAARSLRQSVPTCKVIFVSMYAQPEFVRDAFSIGVSGYFLKSSGAPELFDAIREVLNGNVYVSSGIAGSVLTSYLGTAAPALSLRQREVLALVAEGCSAKQIAARLLISVKTAQFHRVSIMAKLGVHTTAELTRYAIRHGVVSN